MRGRRCSRYSARASAFAGASTPPLTWKELDRPLDPRDFTNRTLPGRLREVGDLPGRLRKAMGIDLDATLDRAPEQTWADVDTCARVPSPW